jgi:hypothetical protein
MKFQRHADPIVAALEDAFAPGRCIADQTCFEFVRDLETAMQPILSLLDTDPQRAVSLYQTVLAGCYLKAEELDDSSGSFGTFVKKVVIHWIHARQKAGSDAVDTASTVLGWIDDDPYGFCSGLEKELGAVLDASGLLAFESLVHGRCEADPDDSRWHSLLRQIYFQQKRTDAYESLANKAGYPADDCLALAKMYAEPDPALALHWVDRGLVSAGAESSSAARYDLPPLRRELLAKLGRGEEALASAWEDFCLRSSKHTLSELLLAKLTESASDIALEGLSHIVTTLLESAHPFLAARLWRAQVLRIVNAGKSNYYETAIDNLERARDCFRQAGRDAEWDKTALGISRAHSRKQGFMREFASVARGERIMRLSFLEAALAKWQK